MSTNQTTSRSLDLLRSHAKQVLAKRLSGEDPANDMSPWEHRALNGMSVFRNVVMDAVSSAEMGHMTAESASELISICDRGIQAFIDLN